jgi:hypothetical protein
MRRPDRGLVVFPMILMSLHSPEPDREADPADVAEQDSPVDPAEAEGTGPAALPDDANEADALEQQIEAPFDDEDRDA